MEDNKNTNIFGENHNKDVNVETKTDLDSTYSYSYVGQERNDNIYYTNGNNNQGEVHQGDNQPKKEEKKPKKKGFGSKLIKCTALALTFGLVSGTVFHGTGYLFPSNRSDVTSLVEKTSALEEKSGDVIPITSTVKEKVTSDVSNIVEQVIPSVVAITNLSDISYQNFFGEEYNQEAESGGSGIIIAQTKENLYIATNNHVVSKSKALTVEFVDGETVAAEIKGVDSDTDLAVISIPIKNIKPETLEKIKVATLGDSSQLKVGEGAIAIGNALGYGQSVTTGVLSALNREVTIEDPETYQPVTNDLLQTDAAINPGNSGGALLNMKGEVIGINSVKYASAEVEGMGYAIPIATAKPIIDELITREKVDESQKAYLGVSGKEVPEDIAEMYNMPIGVYIGEVVAGSAAEKAGILQGDIITHFDDKEIKTMAKLQEQLVYYKAGSEVTVTIQRTENGQYKEHKIVVTLGKKS